MVKPNRKALKEFWYWVQERHNIFSKREAGAAFPWTKDPVLRDFKFTNVFRELDRGTVWYRDHFREPHRDEALHSTVGKGLMVANTTTYRLFNWIPTAEALGYMRTWRPTKVAALLHKRQQAGKNVFTNAHIVRSHFGMPKIDSMMHILTPIWCDRDKLAACMVDGNSLEQAFQLLIKYDYIGGFIAYEVVSDLRHTPILENAHDILTWANPGPGATRGLQIVFPDITRKQLIDGMRWLLADGIDRQSRVKLCVPALEMRDIEHSLCEFFKWHRATYTGRMPRVRFRYG